MREASVQRWQDAGSNEAMTFRFQKPHNGDQSFTTKCVNYFIDLFSARALSIPGNPSTRRGFPGRGGEI